MRGVAALGEMRAPACNPFAKTSGATAQSRCRLSQNVPTSVERPDSMTAIMPTALSTTGE